MNDVCTASDTCAGEVQFASRVFFNIELADLVVPDTSGMSVEGAAAAVDASPVGVAVKDGLATALSVATSAITVTSIAAGASSGIAVDYLVALPAGDVAATRSAADTAAPAVTIPAAASTTGGALAESVGTVTPLKSYAYVATSRCGGAACSTTCGVPEVSAADVYSCEEDGVAVDSALCAPTLGALPGTSTVCCPAADPDTCVEDVADSSADSNCASSSCAGAMDFSSDATSELENLEHRITDLDLQAMLTEDGAPIAVEHVVTTRNVTEHVDEPADVQVDSHELGSREYMQNCGSYKGWCEPHLYCDQDDWLSPNYCDRCPCTGHGSCGRGTNEGAPLPCVCFDGYYGDACAVQCSPTETCNSHGYCADTGSCVCTAQGFIGWWCSIDISGAREGGYAVAAENITHVEVILELDIESIPPNSTARTTFERDFVSDVATTLGIARDRVQIEAILSGSVIVVFAILPTADGAPLPPSSIAMLASDTALTLGGFPALGLRIITEAPPPPPSADTSFLDDQNNFGTGVLAVLVCFCCVACVMWRHTHVTVKHKSTGKHLCGHKHTDEEQGTNSSATSHHHHHHHHDHKDKEQEEPDPPPKLASEPGLPSEPRP